MSRAIWIRRWRAFWLARAPRLFARCCTPDDRELGEWGEEIAARYLASRGWRIVGRRLKTSAAEVDIVALAERAIVCVEVKCGRIEPLPRPRGEWDAVRDAELRWRPGLRCGRERIAALRRAGRALCRELGASRANGRFVAVGTRARVDLIEVLLPTATRRPRILHHPDSRRPLS
jgi:predicted RecB family endonuclease